MSVHSKTPTDLTERRTTYVGLTGLFLALLAITNTVGLTEIFN